MTVIQPPDHRKRRVVQEHLIRYMRANPNVIIPLGELADELGIGDEKRGRATISSSLTRLSERDPRFQRVGSGQYMFRQAPLAESEPVELGRPVTRPEPPAVTPVPVPPASPRTPALWEFVGSMGSYAVLRDEGTQLFVAIPLQEWVTLVK